MYPYYKTETMSQIEILSKYRPLKSFDLTVDLFLFWLTVKYFDIDWYN